MDMYADENAENYGENKEQKHLKIIIYILSVMRRSENGVSEVVSKV